MYTQVTFSDFCDAFRRADRNENFSYEGKRALFDYLEEYEACTGEGVEFDVIAICCDFYESTLEEIIEDHMIDVSDAEDDDDKAQIVEDYLNDNTCLIAVLNNGSFVYPAF